MHTITGTGPGLEQFDAAMYEGFQPPAGAASSGVVYCQCARCCLQFSDDLGSCPHCGCESVEGRVVNGVAVTNRFDRYLTPLDGASSISP